MSSPRYPHLAKPVQIGSIKAKNACFMSSLTRNRAVPTNIPNDAMLEYYVQRAKDTGAGLIFAEGTLITPQGTEWPNAPGIWSDEQVQGWKKITDAVHAEGTPIVLQLWHLGRVSHPDMPEQKEAGIPVYGPSAVAARGGKFRALPGQPGYQQPSAIPDPRTIIDQFEQAAKQAKAAGFDGVEFHGANGYLGEQFLSDVANVRDDQWGGSVENRCRFALETMQRLINVYGADRVGIKLSPCGGYNDLYYTSPEAVKETYNYLIPKLDELSIAWMQITQYNAYGDAKFDGKPQGYDHDVVEAYAHLVTKSNFLANCGYNGEKAEKALAEGKVKAVTFGQGFIANPDYYRREQEGLEMNQGDFTTFYVVKNNDPRIGYCDYPFASDSEQAKQ